VSDGSAVEALARIAELTTAGYGPSAIARRLNADGIPTPSGRGRWHPETVIRHRDPTYRQRNAGYMQRYRQRPGTARDRRWR
jgi:Recombinase